ncbi:MAG: hypothetical protein Q9N68_11840, partial [Gammaproteobacteria bacterium]|nr:hypothetical protein [Gammaproteobacteria bacterium]
MKRENLFANIPAQLPEELFTTLLETANFKLERIVSQGQSTAEDEWYDQDQDEWVLLLQGSAELQFIEPTQSVALNVGDWLHIPAHRKHRVCRTD